MEKIKKWLYKFIFHKCFYHNFPLCDCEEAEAWDIDGTRMFFCTKGQHYF